MNKLDILKGGTELLVSIGVSSIVGNAIKMTTDPTAGKFKKLAIGFGGFVLSSMVGDLATKYATDKIDDTAARIKNIISPESMTSEEFVPDENMLHLHVEGSITDVDMPFDGDVIIEKINKAAKESKGNV